MEFDLLTFAQVVIAAALSGAVNYLRGVKRGKRKAGLRE